jgi:hypothetical protein
LIPNLMMDAFQCILLIDAVGVQLLALARTLAAAVVVMADWTTNERLYIPIWCSRGAGILEQPSYANTAQ